MFVTTFYALINDQLNYQTWYLFVKIKTIYAIKFKLGFDRLDTSIEYRYLWR